MLANAAAARCRSPREPPGFGWRRPRTGKNQLKRTLMVEVLNQSSEQPWQTPYFRKLFAITKEHFQTSTTEPHPCPKRHRSVGIQMPLCAGRRPLLETPTTP